MKTIKILIVLTIITLIGCTRKAVQIPLLGVRGIQDTIYDNSQLWIFHEVKDGDTIATLNRKNSIATTNWIFNIDKKLPLHLVIPHLQKVIKKREKPALHQKGEDDFNYFSYVDTVPNLLSMVQFDVIYFNTDKTIDQSKFENDSLKKHIFVAYNGDELVVNDSLIPLPDLNNYLDREASEKPIYVHLSFDAAIKYQYYLALKARLQNVKGLELDTIEYVK